MTGPPGHRTRPSGTFTPAGGDGTPILAGCRGTAPAGTRMDDRELVIRTGSLTQRVGRVLAADAMSLDGCSALSASFRARHGSGACAASSGTTPIDETPDL